MDEIKSSASNIFEDLDEKVDIVFRHQMLMDTYASIPRDYDVGFFMSEIEVHALGFIERNPGITAKTLGELTYRTKGTISTMLSNLEKGGFIEQRVNPDNMREHNLYLTEKGLLVSTHHTAYDRKTTANYIMEAAKFCTPEEIEGYYKVSKFRADYFEKVMLEERKKYLDYKKQEKRAKGKAEKGQC